MATATTTAPPLIVELSSAVFLHYIRGRVKAALLTEWRPNPQGVFGEVVKRRRSS